MMLYKSFWVGTLERAVRTAAQTGLVLWGADGALPESALSIDWTAGLGVVLTATLLSVLTSLAAGQVGDPATTAFSDKAA